MSENPGKVLSLQEAVRRYVKPGIKLHLAAGIGGPSAAICEIIRQFWGKSPEFTLIQSTVTGHALNLVHANLVRKLIAPAFGQNTEEVLLDICGYDWDKIQELKDEEVI